MTQKELTSKVEAALEEIRPFLQSDGGDIALLSMIIRKLYAYNYKGLVLAVL